MVSRHDEGLLRALRRLPALKELSSQHVRLQVNLGNGGCYTMHTDSGLNGEAQLLRATALFYLNKGWCQEHGAWPKGFGKENRNDLELYLDIYIYEYYILLIMLETWILEPGRG